MGSALPPDEPGAGSDASLTSEPEPLEVPAEASEPQAEPSGEQGEGEQGKGDSRTRKRARTRAERAARRRKRARRVLVWGSASLALLLVIVAGAGYALLRHFNGNIEQDDITGLLGRQPVKLHPRAENILVIGSDTRKGLGKGYGSGFVTDQSDTLMIIHIPADRKWAEVMSIPRDSWVNIPSCVMGDGQKSAPTQFKINEAFAIGNLDGDRTALGVACTVKTVEQNTGIYIDHFVVVNFEGFKDMVAALGGVPECNPSPINDPLSQLYLTAGHHMLTPTQALGYVRARYTLGDGSDIERIGRQQAFMSSLIGQVKSQLLDPLAIYRFLDAATRSVTIDSQLGGITGLYDLGQSLRGLPSDKIAFFTLPNFPRGDVVPGDTANVLWTQPEDNEIFATFRNDVPASSSLFAAQPPQKSTVEAGLSARTARRIAADAASASPSAGSSTGASPAAKSVAPVKIQARTANQNICAG
jgi:LCP family protein required for cell wall assembly